MWWFRGCPPFVSYCRLKIPVHCWKVMFCSPFHMPTVTKLLHSNFQNISFRQMPFFIWCEQVYWFTRILKYLKKRKKQCKRNNSLGKKQTKLHNGIEYHQLPKDDDHQQIFNSFSCTLLGTQQPSINCMSALKKHAIKNRPDVSHLAVWQLFLFGTACTGQK